MFSTTHPDPELTAPEPHSTKGRELDFNDPKSVMQLTKTLLKLDFGLEIELVDDRLCPPVRSTSPESAHGQETSPRAKGGGP